GSDAHPDLGRYVFSARATAGVGGGGVGAGVRWSLSGEGWLGKYIGVGAFTGGWAQSRGALSLVGPEDWEHVNSAGLQVAARTDPLGAYASIAAGLGYGWGTHYHTAPTSFFSDAAPAESH